MIISKSQAVMIAKQWKDYNGLWPSSRMLCRPSHRLNGGGRRIDIGYFAADDSYVVVALLDISCCGDVVVKKDRRSNFLPKPPAVHAVNQGIIAHLEARRRIAAQPPEPTGERATACPGRSATACEAKP